MVVAIRTRLSVRVLITCSCARHACKSPELSFAVEKTAAGGIGLGVGVLVGVDVAVGWLSCGLPGGLAKTETAEKEISVATRSVCVTILAVEE